jgi:hypothetical protein
MDKIERDRIDRMINPPAIIGPETVILQPPLGSTAEYMDYLRQNAEHYRAFFGGPFGDEIDL